MWAVPLPFVREHSVRLPAIQALRNIFLLSDGIWRGGGKDYPVQGDAGCQGGKRRAVGRVGWGTVSVCVCSAGGCVWRQQGRLSLVGGGMVKRFGLPSLSYHQGCGSQIKLSVLFPFSRLTFSPPPSIFLSLSALLPVSLFTCFHLHFLCHLSFFFVFLYRLPRPHSFLFVYILALGSCSTNHVHSLQRTCITAMEMIAFLNNKGNVTRLVLFPIPFPLPAWRGDGQHLEGGL